MAKITTGQDDEAVPLDVEAFADELIDNGIGVTFADCLPTPASEPELTEETKPTSTFNAALAGYISKPELVPREAKVVAKCGHKTMIVWDGKTPLKNMTPKSCGTEECANYQEDMKRRPPVRAQL